MALNEEDNKSAIKSQAKKDSALRKPRGFRIALIALASLVVLFAAILYFLPHFLPTSAIRGIAKSKARELANVDVDFSNLRFGWNGDLVLDDVAIAPFGPDGQPGEPLLTVREARTNIAVAPLLSGKAIINSFDMEGFALKVRREADGTLNLPDFSKAAAAVSLLPARPRRRIALSAVAEAPSADSLPPIELHQVNLRDGVVTYEDVGQNLTLDLGVDHLRVDGKTIDDPFELSGRLLPFPGQPQLGDLPFSGTVAMLKNGEFNPDGAASVEFDVKNLSLHEILDKFGQGGLVPSGGANGMIKAAWSNRRAAVNIPELRLTDAAVNTTGDHVVLIPDTTASLNAVFDPVPGTATIEEMSVTNSLAMLRANGRVDGLAALAHGGLPTAGIDFSGAADFAGASHYLSSQRLIPDNLPEFDGKASFVGKATLPQQNGVPSPTLSVDFNDGGVQVIEHNSGIVAAMDLKGVGVRAAASLGHAVSVNAAVNMAEAPARVFLPPLGDQPLTATLSGGAALEHSPETSRVELRLDNSRLAVPATPWSAAAVIHDAQGRIIADLGQDVVQAQGLKATVNNVIQGGVANGHVAGLMSGNPQGQADLELAGLLEHIKQFLAPVFPQNLLPGFGGSLRSATRLKVEDGAVEALVRGELDNSQVVVNVVPGQSQAEVRSPKATMALLASVRLDNPEHIVIHSLEAAGDATALRFSDINGSSFQGQTGNAVVKAAGSLDAAAGVGSLSNLTVDVGGMSLALGQNGQRTAALTSGIMKIVAAAPDNALQAPLSGSGEFRLPNVNVGIDNLLFKFGEEQSNFGNLRARVVADGYIGNEKRQLVNVRAASLSATPVAVNSRGQFDLGSGALLAEYAARVAPAAMSSLLGYLGLPPALLTDAAVTGTLSYNGSVVSSKGSAQGQLRTGQSETNPFEVAHDLSAAWNPDERSLALDVRRLDGNVKTQAGEAVATMKAQQSKLLLSRAGSKGLMDIRFNGSADPTRNFLLGLTGLFPGMGEIANTLHSAQVGGVYNAWLQIRDKDPVTLSVNAGSVWQGAALSVNGSPLLAEAAKLSAALEGEVAYQDNQVRLSRLLLRSDSGMMQADGTATANLTAGPDNMPNGLDSLEVDLRFVLADIRRAAMVLPAFVPPDLGLTGRVDGELKAAGTPSAVHIDTGVVRFQQFAAKPSPTLDVTIPDGQATFGGTISLHPFGHDGGQWAFMKMFDVDNGQAAVTGMQIHGKAVNEFASSFQVKGGVATIQSARLTIGDGSEGRVALGGTVDFNAGAPLVSARLELRNIPLSEVNSELQDYLQFETGGLNLPAQAGQTAGVQFAGFDKDSILRTIRLDNFNFATGTVTMETGPVLNEELNKARVVMKQNTTDDRTRRITFSGITGAFQAAGDGVILMPQEQPITLTGEDTGDFRAHGSVMANHTIDMRVMVTGKIENLIGFTLPNLIPNLGGGDTTNRLMSALNESAAQGKYGVQVRGPLERPDISGIGRLAGQFMADILKSEILGGILGTQGGVAGIVTELVTDPKEAVKNIPKNILGNVPGLLRGGGSDGSEDDGEQRRARPEDVLKGLGQMMLGGAAEAQAQEERQYQDEAPPQQQQQQQQQQPRPRDVLKGIGRQFGIR